MSWIIFLFMLSRFSPCHTFWQFMMYLGVELFEFIQSVGHWATSMCRLTFFTRFWKFLTIFFSVLFYFFPFGTPIAYLSICRLNFHISLGIWFFLNCFFRPVNLTWPLSSNLLIHSSTYSKLLLCLLVNFKISVIVAFNFRISVSFL